MRRVSLHALLAVTLVCGIWGCSGEPTPTVVEVPETPAVAEKPAVVEPPAVVEKPAVVETPDVVEAPVVTETPAVVETPAVKQPVVPEPAEQPPKVVLDTKALEEGLEKYKVSISILLGRYCRLRFKPESMTEEGKLPEEAMKLLRKLKVPQMSIWVEQSYGVLTDAALPQLTELPIDRIDLTLGPKLTSQGFDVLTTMTGLKKIQIDVSKDGDPRDEDFAKLAKLPELEALYISGHPHSLDGSFLAAFNGHARLEELWILMDDWNCDGLKQAQLLPNLKWVRIRGRLDAEKVAFLRSNPQLKSVSLDANGRYDDAMLALLARHEKLQFLTLHGEAPKLTDAGLQSLAGLTSLETLEIGSNSLLTDAGLAHLSSLSNLDDLSIGIAEGVTDAGMAHLGKLTNLIKLSVAFPNVTDAGLPHLGKLPRLTQLTVTCPKVTDAGMVHLGKLSNLSYLTATFPNVTDAGLESLVPLKELLEAIVLSPKITPKGIEATKAKMSPRLYLSSE